MMNVDRLLTGKIPGPETGIEIKKSICTICDPGRQCGLSAYVKDGKIIKIEGDTDQPIARGSLCSKGAANRQYVYSEDRIKTPLRRVGPRGSGRFEPISWEEAFSVIAEKFNRIKAESGAESVCFYAGYSKWFRPFLKRLAHSFGSPNYLTESGTCATATLMAQKLVFGKPARPDIKNTNCLLVWSSNPFHTNTPAARPLLERLEAGMKMIVIDPRRTPTTERADLHLQLRPGTDGALALAMAHVLIEEDLYDKDFVENYSYGFAEFASYVLDYTPEKAEVLTGVPAAKIIEAARLFATNSPAALMPSASSLAHNTNGLQNYRAIFSLIGLTGNYDVIGGQRPIPSSFAHMAGLFPTREKEFMQSRPYSEMADRIGSERFPVWMEVIDEEGQCVHLPEQLRSGTPYPIKALIGFGLNHRMWPDSKGVLDSFENLEFFVNVDLFMTDSCKFADIVLPACSSLERSELRCWPMGYVTFTQPAIEPLYESRSDTDIIYQIAQRLQLDDSLFQSGYEASLDWILAPSGMTVTELKQHPSGMFVRNPLQPPEKNYLTVGFPTPSGKMEFVSQVMEKHKTSHGLDPLPAYIPPQYSLEGSPQLAKEYPFILNTGSRLPMYVHSRTYRLSWINNLRPDCPALDMNPQDALRLRIGQGDTVRIHTPKDSIVVRANLTQMVMPGVIHMYHGNAAADVNRLIEGDYLDPVSGFPGYKALLCRLEKIS